MKTKVFLLLVALLALTTGIQAKSWDKTRNRKIVHKERRYEHNVRPSATRYASTVTVLPHGYSQVRFDNKIYYYAGGVYYKPLPNRYYEIIHPYAGMIVPKLPYYRTVKVRGRTYYAYQDYLYSKVRTPYGINFRVEMKF